jgi:CBS domain-containing protein
MKVQDVMTHDPECCAPDDDLATAAKAMWDLDCGCVPVVGQGHRILGMLTDRDACMAALMRGKALHEIRVADVMSREVIACKPDDRLRDAQVLMSRQRVRRLPVTDSEGRVIGILSLHDLARAARSARRRIFPSVSMKDLAKTFAEVSRPTSKPAMPVMTDNVAYAE